MLCFGCGVLQFSLLIPWLLSCPALARPVTKTHADSSLPSDDVNRLSVTSLVTSQAIDESPLLMKQRINEPRSSLPTPAPADSRTELIGKSRGQLGQSRFSSAFRDTTTTTTAAATAIDTATTITTAAGSVMATDSITSMPDGSTDLPAQETSTISVLTLISVVALVVTVFVVCLLAAAICPCGTCCCCYYSLRSTTGHTHDKGHDDTSYSFELPPETETPQPPTKQQQQTPPLPRTVQQRKEIGAYRSSAHPTDESASSEMPSSASDDVINFCCLGFQARSSLNVNRNVTNSRPDQRSVPEIVKTTDDKVIQKYRRLTRNHSDCTIRAEEESSRSVQRIAFVESDSDNLSKELMSGSRKQKNRVQRKRRRKSESDVLEDKESNTNKDNSSVRSENSGIAGRQSTRAKYFISQCPYCSCNNLMVNHDDALEDQVAVRPTLSGSKVKHSGVL